MSQGKSRNKVGASRAASPCKLRMSMNDWYWTLDCVSFVHLQSMYAYVHTMQIYCSDHVAHMRWNMTVSVPCLPRLVYITINMALNMAWSDPTLILIMITLMAIWFEISIPLLQYPNFPHIFQTISSLEMARTTFHTFSKLSVLRANPVNKEL